MFITRSFFMANYTWYKLIEQSPAVDETHGGWFRKNHNKLRLAYDKINGYDIITIFVCLSNDDTPKLFETTITKDHKIYKTCNVVTFTESLHLHKKLCEEIRQNYNI